MVSLSLLDRLTHHCQIIETDNESYRFRRSTHEARGRIKTRGADPEGSEAAKTSEIAEKGASPDDSGTPQVDSRKGGPNKAISL